MLLEQIVMQLPMENLYIRAFLRLFSYKVRLDVHFKRMRNRSMTVFFAISRSGINGFTGFYTPFVGDHRTNYITFYSIKNFNSHCMTEWNLVVQK